MRSSLVGAQVWLGHWAKQTRVTYISHVKHFHSSTQIQVLVRSGTRF